MDILVKKCQPILTISDYTTKGVACICKDGVDSIASALKELESQMVANGEAAETDCKLCQDEGSLCGIPKSRVQQKIPGGA